MRMKQLAVGMALGALLSSACGTTRSNAGSTPAPSAAEPESPPPPRDDARLELSSDAIRGYEADAPAIEDRRVAAPPFDTLAYDKVIAYDLVPHREDGALIDEGTFAARVYKQHALTQEEADRLLAMLTKKTTYGGAPAACFEPHLGLVLYEEHRMVGYVSICLACNYLESSMDIPAVIASSTPVYRIGFSDSARSELVGLCRDLSFSHCDPDEQMNAATEADRACGGPDCDVPCVAITECDSTESCPDGTVCDASAGHCMPDSCAETGDCDAAETCEASSFSKGVCLGGGS